MIEFGNLLYHQDSEEWQLIIVIGNTKNPNITNVINYPLPKKNHLRVIHFNPTNTNLINSLTK